MKAAIAARYGPPDVVQLADLPEPTLCRGQLRIRVVSTTVASADWRLRSGHVPRGFGTLFRLALGLRRLRQPILGTELSGVVDAVGPGVTDFAPGDAVIAFPGARMRAHAELCIVPAAGAVVKKPPSLSFDTAAALAFGGSTALYFLRDRARLAPGQRLLVIGASGAVGAAAVQLGHHFAATVTGVTSAANLDFVRDLAPGGPTEALDYTGGDLYTRLAEEGRTFDVIMDCVGATRPSLCKPILADGGRFLMVAAELSQLLGSVLPLGRRRKAFGGTAPERREDLQLLTELAASGVLRPPIDSILPLADIAEAHARVETGRKRGSLVIRVASPSEVGTESM
jgi:NADPH:quinone reductase-like Zn-dependent oxidoreductase